MKGLHALGSDVVYATRSLRRSPILAAAVVLTLALGVGVNTAIFSVVNALILRPLPVRDANRLVVIASQDRSEGTLHGVSFPDLEDYRAASGEVLEDVAGYRVGFVGLTPEGGQSERVLVTWITGNYFPFLDIQPAFGRLIRANEGGPGATNAVAVLGYSAWRRRFGGDPLVVGKIVKVNGTPCTIVGVAPPEFVGTFAFSDSELYLPLNWSGSDVFDNRGARRLHAIARLKAGVTTERAQAAMTVVAERLARQYPDSNANVSVRVLSEPLARPEEDEFRTNARGAAVTLALVSLVMMIAVVNVAHLLLARARSRGREFAIRAALGAGRGRLIRLMATESLLLAAFGGGVGVLLGTWAAHVCATLPLAGDLPVRFDFGLDGRVLAYAVAVTVITGLLVGLVPALRTSRANLDQALRRTRYQSPDTNRRRLGGILVMGQVAVCFVLLVAAGLFARSLLDAERANLGFRPAAVLNLHMDVEELGYTEARGQTFFDDVDQRVRSIPGVQDVSFALTVPMGYVRASTVIEPEGQPTAGYPGLSAGKNIVSTEYFQTMGIRIVRGRSFSAADTAQSTLVAIVNQQLADRLWPAQDPIGRRISFGSRGGPWAEVVGVAVTGKYRFLFEEPQPYVYVPMTQEYTGLRVLQVRSTAPPEALAPIIERLIRARDPNLPVYDVQTMAQALDSGFGFFPVRVGAAAAVTLGLLAFVLAIVGLYGVLSFAATRRTHEMGVRLAVGASPRDIGRLVLGDGLSLVGIGLAAGLVITLLYAPVVDRLLFGVSARDPLTLVIVALLIGSIALIACAIPAWRSAGVDPAITLRSE